MYYVYIIKCRDDTLYTGITTDIKRRLLEHTVGKGSRYTRSHGVKKVVYTECLRNRSFASRREADIKKLSREKKLNLIKIFRRKK